jgi:riboflavin synthase
MFTGIVEETGTVRGIRKYSAGARLEVACSLVLGDAAIGDSIAVNGTCVTVVGKSPNGFEADLSPETMERTTFATLKAGDPVNLERALKLSGRLGGHMVLGHVDCVGTVAGLKKESHSLVFTFRVDGEAMKYIAYKGSVTIDGVSLTVSALDRDSFSVAVIPHTLAKTVLKLKGPGDRVNVECDVLAKYVERLLEWKGGNGSPPITLDSLKEMGF